MVVKINMHRLTWLRKLTFRGKPRLYFDSGACHAFLCTPPHGHCRAPSDKLGLRIWTNQMPPSDLPRAGYESKWRRSYRGLNCLHVDILWLSRKSTTHSNNITLRNYLTKMVKQTIQIFGRVKPTKAKVGVSCPIWGGLWFSTSVKSGHTKRYVEFVN